MDKNKGCYMLVVRLDENKSIKTGALGEIDFTAGWYIYAGSAKKNLKSRIRRHLKREKKLHWHIDFLTIRADAVKAYPVYSENNIECRISAALNNAADSCIRGFGSSDCKCYSHLYYFKNNPEEQQSFSDILHRFNCTEYITAESESCKIK